MLRLVLVIHWLLLMLDVITMGTAAENTDTQKVHMDGVKVIIIICDWLWKTDPNRTFGISRITNLKYLIHSESLLLGCSHAILAV